MHIDTQAIEAAATAGGAVALDRAALQSAVAFLARHVIERRNTLPILSCLIIEPARDGKAWVTGTNLDQVATFTIPAQWDVPAAIALSAAPLADFIKSVDKERDEVRIAVADGRARIACGRAVANMPVDAADNFPVMAMGELPLSWECDAGTLSADFARLVPAMSTEETRYYLQGVALDTQDGDMAFAATDGHRLHVIRRENAGNLEVSGVIIPRHFADMVKRLLAKSDATARVELSASKARVTSGNMVLSTKLIDGTFPDWRRVVPTVAPIGQWTVESDDIAAISCAIGKTKGHRSPSVAVDFAASSRYGITGNDGFARPLPGEYAGDDLAAAFRGDLLHDVAKAAGQGNVTFAMTDPSAPVKIAVSTAPELQIVLMPCRRNAGLPATGELAFRNEVAAPGQAASLWDVHKGVEGNTVKGGARKASSDECKAYMRDYAARCGFNVNGMTITLDMGGPDGICQGATFGDYSGGKRDGEAGCLTPREYQDGSFSVAMPGARDPLANAVLLSVQDEATGEWSDFSRCQNAKGQIALPDAPKGRKVRKAKAGPRPIAVASPVPSQPATAAIEPIAHADVSPEPEKPASGPEIAPCDAIERDADPVAARLDALMARIAELESMASAPLTGEPAPAAIADCDIDQDVGLYAYAMAMAADVPAPPIRGMADRAKRERAARAYLRVRRERGIERNRTRQAIEKGAMIETELRKAVKSAENNSQYHYDYGIKMQGKLRAMAAKRRRAVLKAREMQQRLNAEYTMVDRANEKRREADARAARLGLRVLSLETAWATADKHQRQTIDVLRYKHSRAVKRAWDARRKARAQRAIASLPQPVNVYTDQNGATRHDIAVDQMRHVDQANADREKAEAAQRLAMQRMAAMESAVDGLEEQLLATLSRAITAETALAAVNARLSGSNTPLSVAAAA